MSDSIVIKGIRGFGYHGVFEQETKNGQEFYVDVELFLDLAPASQSDALEDTIDYGAVCDVVLACITGKPVQLIEKLAGDIADALLNSYTILSHVKVIVHKPQAPVNAEVLDISVAIERAR